MKTIKLSLAAALVATSTFAVENVKFDGSVKLWYQTGETTASSSASMFSDAASAGNLVAKLRATGDFTNKLGFGATMYAATMMGLDGNLVDNPALTDSSVTRGDDRLPVWLGEAYVTYQMGQTLVKFGRQELDTPLVYGEVCSCGPVPNTFEAIALINKDIPNTTLIGAVISKANGQGKKNEDGETDTTLLGGPVGGGINAGGEFAGFHSLNFSNNPTIGGATNAEQYNHEGGAFAVGAINTSIPNLTVTPFYYDIKETANAFWIDGTYTLDNVGKFQAMYANLSTKGLLKDFINDYANASLDQTTNAYAIQASTDIMGINLTAAYSKVSEGILPVANASNNFATSKIYTAGYIGGTQTSRIAGAPDVTGYKLSLRKEMDNLTLRGSFYAYDLGANANGGGEAGYYGVSSAYNNNGASTFDKKLNPHTIELVAKTKIDEVNILAAYLRENEFAVDSSGKKLDQDTIRIVARIDFK